MLPGEHEISYHYSFNYYFSKDVSRRYSFEPGKVYRIIGTAEDDRTVGFKFVYEGTVEEMAPIFLKEKRDYTHKVPDRWKEVVAKTAGRGAKATDVAEKPLPIERSTPEKR